MPLPKIKHTLYEHTLYNGKKVQFKSFTSNEQKILLLAKEEGTQEAILKAVKQIIELCTLGKVDTSKLAPYDLELLFLKIRCKSIGEDQTIRLRHDYKEEGKPLSEFIDVTVNLNEIEIKGDDKRNNIIKLNDTQSIVMRDPSFDIVLKYSSQPDLFSARCISQYIDGEDVYDMDSETNKDILEWYSDIETDVMLEIKKFFDSMPSISHVIKVKSEKTGDEIVKELKGLSDFFT